MDYTFTAVMVSIMILLGGVLVVRLIFSPDKAPEPQPAYIGQIRTRELAFPVGLPFTYMGLTLYPYKHSNYRWISDCEVKTWAELSCEYRDDHGVIRLHTLNYAQAMAIATANGYNEAQMFSAAVAAAWAEHTAPLRDDHDHAETYG